MNGRMQPAIVPPWERKSPYHKDSAFRPGTSGNQRVFEASQITDCFMSYVAEREIADEPLDLYSWFAYFHKHVGVGRRWWKRVMRGDPDSSPVPGVQDACEAVENVIAGKLSTAALTNKLHPGLVAQQLKIIDDRDELSAEKEARRALIAEQVPTHRIANIIHPDCSYEQLQAIYAAGLQPIPYTQEQIEAGWPFIMPELPDD